VIEIDKDAYKYRDKANCVLSVVLSADGKTLFSGSDDYTIKIWGKKCETSSLEE
jgi:WD40 repeat protein